MKVLFAKTNEKAIVPSKRKEDAGFDIYACFAEDFIKIKPNETKMIPCEIASSFSPKYVAILHERGSTGTKGIGQRCGVIDSGYRGSWMCPITNHNKKDLYIVKKNVKSMFEQKGIVYDYEKAICQVIFQRVPKTTIEQVGYDELSKIKSTRGVGKLGSSGK